MKFTLLEVKNAEQGLVKIMQKELPIKVSYRISKIINLFRKESSEIEDARVKLVKKYGKEDKEGNIKIAEEKQDEFRNEFAEFLQEEIEINLEPISIEDIGDITISPLDMANMEKIFKEN